jgi:hypothetical protein
MKFSNLLRHIGLISFLPNIVGLLIFFQQNQIDGFSSRMTPITLLIGIEPCGIINRSFKALAAHAFLLENQDRVRRFTFRS